MKSQCLAIKYPKLTKEWHSTKNGKLTPFDASVSSRGIWWKCNKGNDHEWRNSVWNRVIRKQGCPFCKGFRVAHSNCLATINPKLAAEWHPSKNENFTPYDVVAGSDRKVWWKCNKAPDHEWEAAVSSRKVGSGCPCCAGMKTVKSNCLATKFPDVANQWHPTKNGNITPFDIVPQSNKRFWWRCNKFPDHEWECYVANKIRYGCPFCRGRKVSKSNCFANNYPKLMKEWHPTKNTLDPYKIVPSENRAWWICKLGHEWFTKISHRIGGSNCPVCDSSRGELAIADVLETNGVKFKEEFRIEECKNVVALPFDFAVWHEGKMGLIEYQGKQHYKPTGFGGSKPLELFRKIKINDKIKRKYCLSYKIPFLEVPYWKFGKIREIIENFLAVIASNS